MGNGINNVGVNKSVFSRLFNFLKSKFQQASQTLRKLSNKIKPTNSTKSTEPQIPPTVNTSRSVNTMPLVDHNLSSQLEKKLQQLESSAKKANDIAKQSSIKTAHQPDDLKQLSGLMLPNALEAVNVANQAFEAVKEAKEALQKTPNTDAGTQLLNLLSENIDFQNETFATLNSQFDKIINYEMVINSKRGELARDLIDITNKPNDQLVRKFIDNKSLDQQQDNEKLETLINKLKTRKKNFFSASKNKQEDKLETLNKLKELNSSISQLQGERKEEIMQLRTKLEELQNKMEEKISVLRIYTLNL